MNPKNLAAIFLCIVCLGCSPTSTHVLAGGPIPFPTVPMTGGTLILEPGAYACPSSLPTGTHVVGRGAIVPPELLTSTNFAPIKVIGEAPVVRVLCDHSLIIRDASDVQISGLLFDFKDSGGLILDSVTYSRFDMSIVNAKTALTMTTTDGNTFSNVFPNLILYNHDIGIKLNGINSNDVTWNDFGHVELINTKDTGILVSQFSDTNTFATVRLHLLGSATDGVVFNDAGVIGDVDASGNVFHLLDCDAEPPFSGSCAHFKGNTVGNYIVMGFGIMADEKKVTFDTAFSAGANIIQKLQEHPM